MRDIRVFKTTHDMSSRISFANVGEKLVAEAFAFRCAGDKTGTTSAQMREKVIVARAMQRRRFAEKPNTLNGKMAPRDIRRYCRLETDAESLLKAAMEEFISSSLLISIFIRWSLNLFKMEGSRVFNK